MNECKPLIPGTCCFATAADFAGSFIPDLLFRTDITNLVRSCWLTLSKPR